MKLMARSAVAGGPVAPHSTSAFMKWKLQE